MSLARGRWLDIALIVLVFIVIVGLYSTELIDPVILPKFLGWGVALVLSGLTLLFRRSPSLQTSFRGNPAVWALAAYVLISALTLLKSHNLADGSFEWFKGFFLLAFVVFLTAQFGTRQQLLIRGVIIGAVSLAYVGGAFGLYQLAAVAEESGLSHSTSYAVSGTFAHRNLYAEVLFLTLPFSVYGFQLFSRFWRWLCLGAAFVALFIIVILMSRAVWLAVVTGMVVPSLLAFGLALKRNRLQIILRQKVGTLIKITGAIALTVALSILVYSRFDTTTALKKQLVSIVQFNFTYGSIEERINLWSKSWGIIKKDPVAGIGPGDWEQGLLARGNKGMLSTDNKTFFQRPHNDFLWVCSESGLLGLLAYTGIFAAAALMLLRPIYTDPWNAAYRLNYYLLAALSGYCTYALFSFPKERIEHQILLGLILALTSVQASSGYSNLYSSQQSRFIIKAGLGLAIVLISLGVYMGYERLEAEAATQDALRARVNQQPEQVIKHISRAERPLYRIDPMSTPLPWYSGSAHYKLGNHQAALEDFQEAYQLNPYHMHVVNNLGTLYQVTGQTDSAIHYFKQALSLSPGFTGAALNLAAIHYNRKNYKQALQTIQHLSYQPGNAKYKKYLTAILEARGDKIEVNLDNNSISSTVHRIVGTRRWLLSIYEKSLRKRSFRDQLIDDAIYTLQEQEKVISSHKAKKLRKKYLDHGQKPDTSSTNTY